MSNLLITSSFLDSVAWAKKAPSSPSNTPGLTWKEDAYFQLKDQLSRIWRDPTPALKRGMDFERQIYAILEEGKEDGDYSNEFKWFLTKCKNGQFQRKTKRIVEIDGKEYFLYGKIDVWFNNSIKDIKTTENYKGSQKYLDSSQHLIYCFSEGINDFEYLVAEFRSKDELKIAATHSVPFMCKDTEVLGDEIKMRIKDAMNFLELFPEPGDLKELYYTKFNRSW